MLVYILVSSLPRDLSWQKGRSHLDEKPGLKEDQLVYGLRLPVVFSARGFCAKSKIGMMD